MSEFLNFMANKGGDIIAQVVSSIIIIGLTAFFSITQDKKGKTIIRGVFILITVLAIILVGSNLLRRQVSINQPSALAITLEHNSVIVQDGTTFAIGEGDTLRVNVQAPTYNMVQIGWSWDQQKDLVKSDVGVSSVVIPYQDFMDGGIHQLQIEAIINDEYNNIIGNSNIITVKVFRQ